AEQSLADVCFTSNVGRRHFEERLAVQASDRAELLSSLEKLAAGETPPGCARGTVSSSGPAPKIAFLFTGQGSQSAGMGKSLYETEPVFRRSLDLCAQILDPLLTAPLLEVMFAEEGSPAAGLLDQTGFTQPALFALEYALAELWRSWGVIPDVVLGHSVGEI